MIGAVRSNAKFDKFRVQAERILRGNEIQQNDFRGQRPYSKDAKKSKEKDR